MTTTQELIAEHTFAETQCGIEITREQAMDNSTTFTVWIIAGGYKADVWKFDNEKSARAMGNRVWAFHKEEGTLNIGLYNYGREMSADGLAGRLSDWRPQSFM